MRYIHLKVSRNYSGHKYTAAIGGFHGTSGNTPLTCQTDQLFDQYSINSPPGTNLLMHKITSISSLQIQTCFSLVLMFLAAGNYHHIQTFRCYGRFPTPLGHLLHCRIVYFFSRKAFILFTCYTFVLFCLLCYIIWSKNQSNCSGIQISASKCSYVMVCQLLNTLVW